MGARSARRQRPFRPRIFHETDDRQETDPRRSDGAAVSEGHRMSTKTLDEIRRTPVLLLTEEEINQLDPESQTWARKAQAQAAREKQCPGHEAISTGTLAQSMRGWHPAKCKH